MSSWLRVVGLAAVALLLGACGAVHPGTAAVVNGERISMERADAVATTYCVATLAQQPEGSSYDNSSVRRQALITLIVVEMADQLAAEHDLDVRVPSETNPQTEELAGQLDSKNAEGFRELMADNARLQATALALARPNAPAGADDQEIIQLGYQQILAEIAEADIEIDPRFALDAEGNPLADSGALAVPTENIHAPAAELRAAALRCS